MLRRASSSMGLLSKLLLEPTAVYLFGWHLKSYRYLRVREEYVASLSIQISSINCFPLSFT